MKKWIVAVLSSTSMLSALTLQQALEYSFEHSPDIQISLSELKINQAELGKRLGSFLPSIDGSTNYLNEHYKNNNTQDPTSVKWRQDYTLSATQNVFDGFGRYNNLKSSQRQVLAVLQLLKDQAATKTYEIGQAYLKIIMTQQLVDNAKENFKNIKEIADLIEKRAKEGLSKDIEKIQADGRLALARSNLLQTLGQLYKDKAQFKQLTGGLDPIDLTSPNLKLLDYPNFDEYWKSVQEYGWKLKQYYYLQDAAYYQYQASKSSMYPTIDAVASYNTKKRADGSEQSIVTKQWGLKATYNFFRGNQDFQDMYGKAQKFHQAKFEAKRQLHQLENDAMNVWQNFKVGLDSSAFLQQNVQSTLATARSYKDQFLLGQKTLLDLLDAHNEYLRAKNSYDQNNFETQSARLIMSGLNSRILELLAVKGPEHIFVPAEKEKEYLSGIVKFLPNSKS